MSPLETYASVVLHSGCALPPKGEYKPRKHNWGECISQRFYLKIARKTQHKLNSNSLCIGKRITVGKIYAALLSADIGGYNTVDPIEAQRAASKDAHRIYESLNG